ncbi:ribonuclease H-like domain-containing protein [Tanacetum coccineum]|uniref:Ribonuclease H-like domain-containing protein n=1 Tax=Tanacetum coccineum TaxID=301880 RepID=A0ABQ5G0A8_9ASTR
MVPRAVLMKSGLLSINTARQVNTAYTKTTVNGASPMSNFSKTAHSTVKRPIHKKTTFKNSNINQRVNTVGGQSTARFAGKSVIDSGCSRHMTGNMSNLTDFEEIDEGYVAFGGNPKGGKITGRDHLGKFDGKADEGFFIGYSINSKAFRVFNSRTRIVEENLHVQFRNQSNDNAGKASMKTVPGKDYILLPLWTADPPFSQISKISPNAGFKPSSKDGKKVNEDSRKDSEGIDQVKEDNVNSTNNVNAASTNEVNAASGKTSIELPDDPNMPALEDIVYSDDDDEDVGAEADMNNLDAFMRVSPIPTTRIHKDYPVEQIIGDLNSAPQTRRMKKNLEEHGLFM